MSIKVTVWNENIHERNDERVKAVYPDGIHNVIAQFLSNEQGICVRTATLEQPEHGLTDEVLSDTDVLIWWAHMAHNKVSDEIVERVYSRILSGMGLIVLHSGHNSKIFKKLMGTSCSLKWRECAENERIWIVEPSHKIVQGLEECIEIEHDEMYGERFDIPAPDELVLITWFKGGEVFRSGCCYNRGYGKVFYFQPGHETYPVYYNNQIQKVITNAVKWAMPEVYNKKTGCFNVAPLEKID